MKKILAGLLVSSTMLWSGSLDVEAGYLYHIDKQISGIVSSGGTSIDLKEDIN